MFIRPQRVRRDGEGRIVSGSASLMETRYDGAEKYRSRQTTVERLGKVLYLSDDGRSGVFVSPTRGLVEYDADANEFRPVDTGDPRIAGHSELPEPEAHVRFGDVYLLSCHLRSSGMAGVLSDAFGGGRLHGKAVVHLMHGLACGGSRVSCDAFYRATVLPHIVEGLTDHELRSDTSYFAEMGAEDSKLCFFRAYVMAMRSRYPCFGRCCYVDSTPLPGGSAGNPFNKLSSHGVEGSGSQTRLALVLDHATGLPVWFELFPGDALDLSTLRSMDAEVFEALEIGIESYVLDAGYVTKDVVKACGIGSGKSMLARMPAKKGYPFKELYASNKGLFDNAKYHFMRGDHDYFGIRREVEVFGEREYAYVYVDRVNAANYYRRFISDDPEGFEGMRPKDRNWARVRGGFFVLLSNVAGTPKAVLDMYFDRTRIEAEFKKSKTFLNLLPLCKWSEATIKGKMLEDVIELIAYNGLSGAMSEEGESMANILWQCGSDYCLCRDDGTVVVETPTRQVKGFFSAIGEKVPPVIRIEELKRILDLRYSDTFLGN